MNSCLFLKEMPLCIKAGFKKASLITDSFISEVKSRRRWRPGMRGGRVSPPRKLNGKKEFRMHCYVFYNVSQRRSLKKEFRMHCYVFGMYLKDGPLRRSSECIAMYSECISKMVP